MSALMSAQMDTSLGEPRCKRRRLDTIWKSEETHKGPVGSGCTEWHAAYGVPNTDVQGTCVDVPNTPSHWLGTRLETPRNVQGSMEASSEQCTAKYSPDCLSDQPNLLPQFCQEANIRVDIGADQVCFGMITGIPAQYSLAATVVTDFQIPVTFKEASRTLVSTIDGSTVFSLEQENLNILQSLVHEPGIDLQLFCRAEISMQPLSRGTTTYRTLKSSYCSAYVSVIIYGPLDLFEDIGKFFEDHTLYLQDPRGCDRNVPYRNPHCLWGEDEAVPLTLGLAQQPVYLETVHNGLGLLADLESNDYEHECEAPPALKTVLYKHQKQALSFMLRRECGWALHDAHNDIWSIRTCPSGFTTYFNNITEESQCKPPPEFRGGILADHMGLGKSLSMIALIASDQTNTQLDPDASVPPSDRRPRRKKSVRSYHPTTLLIIPSSLIQTWDTQLVRHLHRGALRWFKHHGTQKLTKVSRLHDYDIVISTFQTVSSEYKSHSTDSSILFSTVWHRIVLDEAHCIRNQNTITAKAICALQGRSRWAMTGTPIQNRLPDFMSLLKFLRPYPFSDSKIFQTHVIDVWKTHSDDTAIKRLKKLVKCLSLRRSKCPIDLPERNDMIVYLEFSHAELMKYRQLENPTLEMIDEALCSDRVQAESYMHVLSRINVLRMICNLGLSAKSIRYNLDAPTQGLSFNQTMVQEASEELASLGQLYCTICSLDLEPALEETFILSGNSPQASFTTCLRLICAKCISQPLEDAAASVCVCKPGSTCSLTPISTKAPMSPPAVPSSRAAIEEDFPTKITTLITRLERVKDKKSIVFSSWTTTFDLIEVALKKAHILYVRVDGRVSTRNRSIAFEKFRNDYTIKVMLLTISCGAEGLDLTAASCVYLMEPQWNPTIEEQALARVHRLGQTKNVTAVRFIIKDSIEHHVLKVQDRKRNLADLMLSQEHVSQNDLNRSKLQHLRSLLS